MNWIVRRVGWVVFALAFALFLPTTGSTPTSVDVTAAEVASWTVVRTGHPWIEQQVSDSDLPQPYVVKDLFTTTRADGHVVITRAPGVVLAGIPADVVARLLGYDSSRVPQWPARITVALLAAWALALMALALDVVVPRPVALASVLALGVTTPFWSVLAHALFTHTVTGVAVAGMAYAASRNRWWWVGIFAGIGAWGRLHLAVIAAVLGVVLAWRRRDWRIVFRVGLPGAAFVGLASLWSHWFYGGWSPQGGYASVSGYAGQAADQGLGWIITNQLGFWFSPEVGVFVWTPALLLLIPALVRHWRSVPDWAQALAVGGLLYLVVQGSLDVFTGGFGFWGYRLPLEPLVAATPALASAAARLGPGLRRVLVVLLGAQGGLIGIGALLSLSTANGHGWSDFVLGSLVARVPVGMAFVVLSGIGLAFWVARLLKPPARSSTESPAT